MFIFVSLNNRLLVFEITTKNLKIQNSIVHKQVYKLNIDFRNNT